MNDDLNKLSELDTENNRFYNQYPLAMLALQTLKEITTRVSTIEARIDLQQNRLSIIEEKIRALEWNTSENLESNKKIIQILNEHISTQNKELRSLLFWIIVSLISILTFGVTFMINYIMPKI